MSESVLMYRDYGEIVFDLKSIMDKKGYTINYVVKRTGLHHQIVRRYYEGTALRYDKEILAKICYVIDCDLEDIMYYKRPKK